MKPVTVLNAIVFGSATAISFGLLGVVVIYLVLKGEHPELAQEFPTLLKGSGLFVLLASVSGISLFALLKELKWRRFALAMTWATTVLIVLLYWPR